MYMPRKPYDLGIKSDSLDQLAQQLLSDIDYTASADMNKEMDIFWARCNAKFITFCEKAGKRYYQYVPCKFFTYRRLSDIIEDHFDIQNKRNLELGCGSGIGLIILAQDGARVEGFDISFATLIFLKYCPCTIM